MLHVGGKNANKKTSSSDSKRHFTVVMGNKEHGLYVSSSPSSAARKAVSKLCATDKKRKVEFKIREITQGSKKKTYGPYLGAIEKLKEPIELKGRVIRYKPVAKLRGKISKKMKGGIILGIGQEGVVLHPNINNKRTNQVSKLIQIPNEKINELIEFETKLNDIDRKGQFHVKMIPEKSGKLSQKFNNINGINSENKIEFKQKMKIIQNNGNRIIEPNFKITYEYGGISIEHFLENYRNYEEMIDPTFCKNILLGIANIFEGLHRFHIKGIHHLDLHAGNIVFLLGNSARGNPAHGNSARGNPALGNSARGNPAHGNSARGNPALGNSARGNPALGNSARGNPALGNSARGNPAHGNPANMRIIDWGNLLEPLRGDPYVESLFSFNNECIIRLIEILKRFDKKLNVVKLDEFLKIPDLLIFKKRKGINETLQTNPEKITNLPNIIIKFVENFDI
jgi:hypothetical protein